MTSKERAELKSQANGLTPLFQIGKEGFTQAVATQTLDAFNTRELLKVRVLRETAPEEPRNLAEKLAIATGSEIVQVIGGVIILYKQNPNLGKPKEKVKPKKKSKPLANVKAKRARELEKKKEKEQKNRFYMNKARNSATKRKKDNTY